MCHDGTDDESLWGGDSRLNGGVVSQFCGSAMKETH
jgi:hypothetical protein